MNIFILLVILLLSIGAFITIYLISKPPKCKEVDSNCTDQSECCKNLQCINKVCKGLAPSSSSLSTLKLVDTGSQYISLGNEIQFDSSKYDTIEITMYKGPYGDGKIVGFWLKDISGLVFQSLDISVISQTRTLEYKTIGPVDNPNSDPNYNGILVIAFVIDLTKNDLPLYANKDTTTLKPEIITIKFTSIK